jgi:hypothetical protein
VEKECLRILLRGRQPIVICPARSIENIRISRDWRTGIEAGRLLLLSPFSSMDHRVTAALAERRNEFVAALADEACLFHASPGGKLSRLAQRIQPWGIPFQVLGDQAHRFPGSVCRVASHSGSPMFSSRTTAGR